MAITYGEMAQRLRNAYSAGVVEPLRDGLAPADGDGAYAVQHINTRFWQEHGRRIVGRKIGLTSKVVQNQLGVDQPDFGTLFADMQITDGGELYASKVLQPKAEAEVAIILASDLNNPEATAEDVFAACDCAMAAIEIVDSRIADWKITFADTVADNGSSAYFVLSAERKTLTGLDLFTCGMAMTVNGAVASSGVGVACLGHPLHAAAWLARSFARSGEGLKAGDIILTGALGPMVAIKPGGIVEAQIGGLGTVRFTYREDRT